MRNLPIDQLRALVNVIELGGFTPAAELLGRSQPAISLQIKRLETLVDQTLITRQGQHLGLTESGKLLFDHAKKILAINDLAVTQLAKTPVDGEIRFGIPSEFATTLMPKVLGSFAKAYPNVSLDVNCALSKQLLSESGRRQYDIILGLHDHPDDAGADLLAIDELVWVCADDGEAFKSDPLPLIAAPDGCIYRKRAISMLKQHGAAWRVVYTIPDLSGIQAAIQEGLGVTVLAKSTVPASLRMIKPGAGLPDLGSIGISLINQRKERHEAVDLLMEFVRLSIQGNV